MFVLLAQRFDVICFWTQIGYKLAYFCQYYIKFTVVSYERSKKKLLQSMQACKKTLFKTTVMSQLVKFSSWSNRSYVQIVYPTVLASQGGFNKYYTVWLYGARPPSNNQHFINLYEFDDIIIIEVDCAYHYQPAGVFITVSHFLMTQTNTLAYYAKGLITALFSFMIQALSW